LSDRAVRTVTTETDGFMYEYTNPTVTNTKPKLATLTGLIHPAKREGHSLSSDAKVQLECEVGVISAVNVYVTAAFQHVY
jgi:hypothetical protein